jgi:hypothetical protein
MHIFRFMGKPGWTDRVRYCLAGRRMHNPDRVESSRTRCNPNPLVAAGSLRGPERGNRRRLNGYF